MRNKVTKHCPACEKSFEVTTNHKNKIFCSKECRYSRPEYNPFYGKRHTDEVKTIISEANKRKVLSKEARKQISERQIGNKNHFFGKRHDAYAKKKMSERRYGRRHSQETRDRMSKARIAAMGKGPVFKNARRGEYKGINYDSLYELKRIYQLENDPSVEYFEKNANLIIKYQHNGSRRYIPDFMVRYKNGDVVVEEIKGYETEKDKIKYSTAKEQLLKVGIRFRVLYFNDLFNNQADYRNFLGKVVNG